jgi:hypothetical protein
MDIWGKALGKVGEAATVVAATAAQQRRLEIERRTLAELRSEALRLRAQIGEEMYKLWQAKALPPSSLDYLFRAIDDTMVAIADQLALIDRLTAQRAPSNTSLPDGVDEASVIDVTLPPPPPPAAPTRRLAAPTCPTCGAPVTPGGKYCGDCGTRLD